MDPPSYWVPGLVVYTLGTVVPIFACIGIVCLLWRDGGKRWPTRYLWYNFST